MTAIDTPATPPAASYSTPTTTNDGLNALWATIWRRKWIIIALVSLSMLIGWVYVGNLSKQYRATATVIIDGRRSQVIDIKSVLQELRPNHLSLRGQVEVIKSRVLAERVAEEQGLINNGYFNPELARPQPFFNTLNPILLIKKAYKRWAPEPQAAITDPDEHAQRLQETVVNRLMKSLKVEQIKRAPVLRISVSTDNPALSATLANAVANAYVLSQLEAKFEATRKATDWLSKRLEGLRQKVLDSERAVAEFRSANKLLSGKGSSISQQNLSDLNAQLIVARTEAAQAQARYEQARRLARSKGSAQLAAASQTLGSKVLDTLLVKETDLQRGLAELGERYGERHPKMIKTRSELKEIRARINSELNKIVQVLKNRAQLAHSQQRSLRNSLNQAKHEAAKEGSASVSLRELEREAEANRLLYENFLGRFKETSQQQGIENADARLLSEATIPRAAFKPNPKLILSLIFFASLGIGLALVLLIEHLDAGLRSAEDIEAITGLPTLAMIAKVKPKRGQTVERFVSDQALSAATEAVRSLYTSIRLSDVDSPSRQLLLSSTLSGEGKTTLAIWLAQVAASQGQNVLLIDGDLRRSRVHHALGLKSEDLKANLVDVLSGDVALDDAIIDSPLAEPAPAFHVLPGKAVDSNALNLLSSKAFAQVLDTLRERYDLVIVDGPPILAVSESRVLLRTIDASLFAVRWNETDQNAVANAIKQTRAAIADSHHKLLGVAVTQVDTAKHARYGYGDAGHYYGRYKSYYHDG